MFVIEVGDNFISTLIGRYDRVSDGIEKVSYTHHVLTSRSTYGHLQMDLIADTLRQVCCHALHAA